MAETPVRRARIGEEWDDAETLAEQLAQITGQRIGIADYVRAALTEHNARMRRVVEAIEIPAGDIVITSTETIVGDRALGPGTYRIAGTTDLIEIRDHDRPTAREIAAAMADYEQYQED